MKATRGQKKPREMSVPEGGVRLKKAMKTLLRKSDFSSITTARIAKTAGVNEALIYRYFGDKRGLLHALLMESGSIFLAGLEEAVEGMEGALDRLRLIVKLSVRYYIKDRVFARILLLEVRNYNDYFESETYELVREYSRFVSKIIQEGMDAGEIRDDVSCNHIRDVLLGGIEHVCLPGPIFKRKISADSAAEDLIGIVFDGIVPRKLKGRRRQRPGLRTSGKERNP